MEENNGLRAFVCHSSRDARYAIEVAKHLKRSLPGGVFYFEEHQRADQPFPNRIKRELEACQVMVIFVGSAFTRWQDDEVTAAFELDRNKHFLIVLLPGCGTLPTELNLVNTRPRYTWDASKSIEEEAFRIARDIVVEKLECAWLSSDGLPLNPHLFEYEKDIIRYFIDKLQLDRKIQRVQRALDEQEPGAPARDEAELELEALQRRYDQLEIRRKQLEGCPSEWPRVEHWIDPDQATDNLIPPEVGGNFRPDGAMVIPAALSTYHLPEAEVCMVQDGLCLPEAGPREKLALPRSGQGLRVAVLVSGGIAPGINAVINGITQRHHMHAQYQHYPVHVYGIRNGFQAFSDLPSNICTLMAEPGAGVAGCQETHSHANEGGSILGTSRFEELLNESTRWQRLNNIAKSLEVQQIDILYIIGGEGSMNAAHAIWNYAKERAEKDRSERRLSVVGIPKTMDNDILWVWQTFGFLSAVERAREAIEFLATEVQSNPRLGVIQLFGSDSGYVVSHAVLAASTRVCDAALIPEIMFRLDNLANYLKARMCRRHEEQPGSIPYGFVVLAETAIPTDAMDYVDDSEIGLSDDEKQAVEEFDTARRHGRRIQGQTDDLLRTAGLKIVSRGLLKLLMSGKIKVKYGVQPDWRKLRVVTNEPRHLLRSAPPLSIDIINAQRLGILAVDNALAGYTDFMISQWLTEYVLVPLKLVMLGRKRIPRSGVFWKSVLAKTGQPFDMA
jgi:6-phosphofructokinase 1